MLIQLVYLTVAFIIYSQVQIQQKASRAFFVLFMGQASIQFNILQISVKQSG